jgi:hypothetical protein
VSSSASAGPAAPSANDDLDIKTIILISDSGAGPNYDGSSIPMPEDSFSKGCPICTYV